MNIKLVDQLLASDPEKIEVIKKITQFHPGMYTETGFSYYVGGLGDHGDWYWDKLLDAHIDILTALLAKCEEDDRKTQERFKQEQIERDRVASLPKEEQDAYYFANWKKEQDTFAQLVREREMYMIWGKPKN